MDSILSQSVSGLTSKQQKLLDELSCLVSKIGIKLEINPSRDAFFGNCPYSLDVEHNEQGDLVGIGICRENSCFYYTFIPDDLKSVLENSTLICHNGVSDFDCLRQWGINVSDNALVWDTMLIGHILDSSLKSYSLKDMAKRELGIIYPSYDDIVGKRGLKAERTTLDKQPIQLVALYNACDTFCTYQLYLKQRKALNFDTL